ncbi:MAG TPA: hypothetical protein VF701_21745 [Thermoanaerobaculia bacterium]
MNLSPEWVRFFANRGFIAEHWSNVGEFSASDRTIMTFARASGPYSRMTSTSETFWR